MSQNHQVGYWTTVSLVEVVPSRAAGDTRRGWCMAPRIFSPYPWPGRYAKTRPKMPHNTKACSSSLPCDVNRASRSSAGTSSRTSAVGAGAMSPSASVHTARLYVMLAMALAETTSGCGTLASYIATRPKPRVAETTDESESVTIDSEPSGARIVRNGTAVGTTPAALDFSYQIQKREERGYCWVGFAAGLVDLATGAATLWAANRWWDRHLALMMGGTVYGAFGFLSSELLGLACGAGTRSLAPLTIPREHTLTLAAGGWEESLTVRVPMEPSDLQEGKGKERPEAGIGHLAMQRGRARDDGAESPVSRKRRVLGVIRGLERSDWQEAERQDTVAAYQRYLARYPTGGWRKDASDGIEQSVWKHAKEQGTLEAYQDYQAKYPKGRWWQDASDTIERLVWEQARGRGTLKAYLDYQRKYPKGRWWHDARNSMEKPAWEQAQAQDTPEEYRRFLNEYPSGRYSQAAEQRLRAATWLKVRKKDTPEAYRDYLARYPTGNEQAAAKLRLGEVLWPRVEAQDSPEAYREYLEQHPSSRYAPAARKAIARLDDVAWQRAKAQGTAEAYASYLSDYKDGKHAHQAGRQLEAAEAREHAPPADERACNRGSAAACWRLGSCFERGEGRCAKDLARATGLYEKACKGGHMRGCVALGFCYRWGECGLQKDPKRAGELYQKACGRGHLEGCAPLGSCYELGDCGLPRDEKRAVQILRDACNRHDQHACTSLFRCHQEGRCGLPKDLKQAAEMARKTCEVCHFKHLDDCDRWEACRYGQARLKGEFRGVSFWAADGGKRIMVSGGSGILKNEEGQIVAEGPLETVAGALVVSGRQGATFVHRPGKKALAKGVFPQEVPQRFATVELREGNRWILRDAAFHFVLEVPKLAQPRIQVNVESSLARASTITLPRGSYHMWGYAITVASTGSVTFANGRVVKTSQASARPDNPR